VTLSQAHRLDGLSFLTQTLTFLLFSVQYNPKSGDNLTSSEPYNKRSNGLNHQDIEIIDNTQVHSGYFRVDRYSLKHKLFNGKTSTLLSREVLERGHAAAVLPYDPDLDRIVLIEQFRIGAMTAHRAPWQLECIAGIIEQDESVESVIHREAMEEAGCTISDIEPIADYLSSPGATSETVALYCGRTESKNLGGLYGLAEEGEDIRVHTFSFSAMVKMLERDEITNAMTLIALQWLVLHRDRVASKWLAEE
tara:strand:- start:358 stop:1110 length:753 start_codon:yes stop_codon:yes gene_type:complete